MNTSKTPSFNIQELINNPSILKELSPESQNWAREGKAYGKIHIYDFAKIVSGAAAGIIKLHNDAQSAEIGITNIEKSKLDSDFLLLGVGLFVAYNTAEITDLKAQVFSNLGQTPSELAQDSDSTAAFSAMSSRIDRISAAIRNSELRVVAGGNTILKAKADKFFLDSQDNNLGLGGDFGNYFSLLNAPRLITKEKKIETVLENPIAIGNYFAIRIEYYGLEINQI